MRTPQGRHALACAGVAIAAGLGGLGLLISLYPGGEATWFGTAAVAAAAGVASPKRRLRVGAIALAALFAGMAWLGHERGVAYAQFLQEREVEPYSPGHNHKSRPP
ncbi:MAG: hypothetical protein MUE46_04760 [Xanthomonadales bacterium]|jgi:hypothetical protein|nr:hypothetical protein [Xanthomonadales bacterium]